MSHESGHNRGKIVAEVGAAAGLGLAAAGTAAFLIRRRRQLEAHRAIDEDAIPQYRRQLALFDTENVGKGVPNSRHILAATAVRIFYATRDSSEAHITKEALLQQFNESSDPTLHVTPHNLQRLLGHLSDKKHLLIARRASDINPKVQGYYALPALQWGLEFGECPAILLEAQDDFMNQQF